MGVSVLCNGFGNSLKVKVDVYSGKSLAAGTLLGTLAGSSTLTSTFYLNALPNTTITLTRGNTYVLVFHMVSGSATGTAAMGLDTTGTYTGGFFNQTSHPTVTTNDAVFATFMRLS